jgi:hypothetical protein
MKQNFMSDKKRNTFFTLFFFLVLKTSVLSRVRVEGWEHELFLALKKKPGEKKFYFFFIEQIVITADATTLYIIYCTGCFQSPDAVLRSHISGTPWTTEMAWAP